MRKRAGMGALVAAVAVVLAGCGGDSGPSDSDNSGNVGAKERSADDSESGGDVQAEPGDGTQQDADEPRVAPDSEPTTSTFALDVDTGSYSIARASINEGRLPDPAEVRTEEFVNYFTQDYSVPDEGIGINVDGTALPAAADPTRRIIRVGLQGAGVEDVARKQANLTVVVDVSGSMEGEKLQMVKDGLTRLVDSLQPDDRIAIVTYSDDAELLLPMTPMTDAASIHSTIDELVSISQTNLEAGLRLGYEHARANLTEGAINRVVLLSDGVANVGVTDPNALAKQIAQEAGDSTQLAVIGVGRDTYDDVILEQFADQGNGFYAFLDSPEEAERLFVNDLTSTLQTVALDAKVQVNFDPSIVRSHRLVGYENRQLDSDDLRDDTVDGGEVGAGHTVTALYEVELVEGADVDEETPVATVDVRWRDPETGSPVENSASLAAADLAPRFEEAPVRLQQDVLVALFAEVLRAQPTSDQAVMSDVAARLEELSTTVEGDADLDELAELSRTAAAIGGGERSW